MHLIEFKEQKMPKYTDLIAKLGKIFKYSEEVDPGYYVCFTKTKASALKNTKNT